MKALIPDEMIRQNVAQRLSRMEAPGRDPIIATIRDGDVTLSGKLSYEHQRRVVVNAARSVEGVRRVIDRLRVVAPKRR